MVKCNCKSLFATARLQQNSHPERRPGEDLIGCDQAALPAASHGLTDTCSNCLTVEYQREHRMFRLILIYCNNSMFIKEQSTAQLLQCLSAL